MPIKVRVRDFQSIGDVSIEIDGLTVVTGANNTGKSALMRAIRAAVQNAKGTSFVRHGKVKSIVEMDFGDGQTLLWEKGKAKADKPTYSINGGTPIHPGQAVPDEVRELGIKPIMAGGREVWPQIARQFDQVFLLDQPGSVMADAVADVDRVSKLNEALRLAQSDYRAATGELNTRRNDLLTLDKELQRFKGLDDLNKEMLDFEAKAVLISRLETALQGIIVLRDRRKAAEFSVVCLSGIVEVTVPNSSIGDGLHGLVQEREALERVRARLERARNRVLSLNGIQDVAIPDSTAELARVMTERDDLVDLARRYKAAKSQVARLEKAELADGFDTAMVERANAALADIKGLRDHLSVARSRMLEAERELLSAQADLDKATEELTSMLGGFPQCPVCLRPFHNSTESHDGVDQGNPQ